MDTVRAVPLRYLGYGLLEAWSLCLVYNGDAHTLVSIFGHAFDPAGFSLIANLSSIAMTLGTFAILLLHRHINAGNRYALVGIAAVLNMVGTVAMFAGTHPMAVAGSAIGGVANAVLWVSWGSFFVTLDPPERERVAIASAVVQSLTTIVVMLLPHVAQLVIIPLLAPLATTLWWINIRSATSRPDALASPDIPAARNTPTASPARQAQRGRDILLFAFGVGVPMAISYYLYNNESPLTQTGPASNASLIAGALVFSVLLWWFVHFADGLNIPSLGRAMSPLLALATCFLAFNIALPLGTTLVVAASMFGQYFILLYGSRLVDEGFGNATYTFSLLLALSALMATVGSIVAALLQIAGITALPQFHLYEAIAVLVALLAYTLTVWSIHSQSLTAQSAAPRVEEDTKTHMLHMFAVRHHLSNRETEIVALLSDGRSAPFIRDHLMISLTTVNTHIRRIYAKLGIHSRQELLDLLYQEQQNSR